MYTKKGQINTWINIYIYILHALQFYRDPRHDLNYILLSSHTGLSPVVGHDSGAYGYFKMQWSVILGYLAFQKIWEVRPQLLSSALIWQLLSEERRPVLQCCRHHKKHALDVWKALKQGCAMNHKGFGLLTQSTQQIDDKR